MMVIIRVGEKEVAWCLHNLGHNVNVCWSPAYIDIVQYDRLELIESRLILTQLSRGIPICQNDSLDFSHAPKHSLVDFWGVI